MAVAGNGKPPDACAKMVARRALNGCFPPGLAAGQAFLLHFTGSYNGHQNGHDVAGGITAYLLGVCYDQKKSSERLPCCKT